MPQNKELEEFYHKFVRQVEAMHGTPHDDYLNVSRLIQGFKDVGVTDILKEGGNPRLSAEQFGGLIKDLGLHLGLRLGTIVVLNHVETAYQVFSGTLIGDSIQGEEYLNRPLIHIDSIFEIEHL
jgi:hypothetical protein